MNESSSSAPQKDRRSEPRSVSNRYFSVEFSISGAYSSYQFKLRNISDGGLCILVKEGSDVLKKVSVGDVLNMKFYIVDEPNTAEVAKTEIKHITQGEPGRYEGRYLIGLSILERRSAGIELSSDP